ncbi:MAG: branched-chain amino acid ABC transporter permease [Clostridia bacterium]|nr:branched-chain amino acid ABC transporter permease [Clostridia bacterium]
MANTVKKSSSRQFKLKYHINYMLVALVAVVLGIMSKTGVITSRSSLEVLQQIAIAILLTVSLSVVVGFLGELSLGHAGFMCVGAFLGGKFANDLYPLLDVFKKREFSEFLEKIDYKPLADLLEKIGYERLNDTSELLILIACMIVGGIFAALAGLIVGLPALRLRGDYLAIVTLAFGEIVHNMFMTAPEDIFGGPSGFKTPKYDIYSLFIIALVAVVICIILVQNIMRSKHGRAITSIRDSEIAARATGINVTKYKLIVFMVAAFFAGVAGVLYSFTQTKVQTEHFTYIYSIEILVMVVLGGMGNINGAIISAVLITFLDNWLRGVLGEKAIFHKLIYAVVLIIIVVYNNAPALKSFREKYSLSALMGNIFKKKNDPAKPGDDEAKWHRVPTKIEIDEVLSTKIQRDPTTSIKPDKGGKK